MRKLWFLMLLAALPGAGGCSRVNDKSVLATVGADTITVREYRLAYEGMKAEDRPVLKTPEARRQFLDDLVDRKLMEHVALTQYPELNEQQQGRFARFRDTELRTRLEKRLIEDQIPITKEMKDQLYADTQREVHAMGLLIVDPGEADYVWRRLQEGESFSMLAADHSAAWVSEGMEPGDMGWLKAGQLPWPVHRAVWDGKPGDLVGPFKLSMGTYIHRVLADSAVAPPGPRDELDTKLGYVIMQELYLNRQKEVQDSLKAAQSTAYTTEGKALVMSKFYWEVPPEFASDPMAKLNAERFAPTFTAEEGDVVVVDFSTLPDWTLREFTNRLTTWYPSGLWPTGSSENEVDDLLDMMVRDYLKLEAAIHLGIDKDPDFVQRLENKQREMRVTRFYFSEVLNPLNLGLDEVTRFFETNRERYRAPASYKVAFFAAPRKDLVMQIATDWKAGASFGELRARYEPQDTALTAVGESSWLYEGQDLTLDNIVRALEPGGVSDPVTSAAATTVYQLVVKRPSRLLGMGELHDQVAQDAREAAADERLKAILDQERKQARVTINEGTLKKVKLPEMPLATASK